MKRILFTLVGLPLFMGLVAACISGSLEWVGRFQGENFAGEAAGVFEINDDAEVTVHEPTGLQNITFVDGSGNTVGQTVTALVPVVLTIPNGAETIIVTNPTNEPPPPQGSGGGESGNMAQGPVPGPQVRKVNAETMQLAEGRLLSTRKYAIGFPLKGDDGSGLFFQCDLDLWSPAQFDFGSIWAAIRPVILGGPGTPVPSWLHLHDFVSYSYDEQADEVVLVVAERAPLDYFQVSLNKQSYATLSSNSLVSEPGNGWHTVEVRAPRDAFNYSPIRSFNHFALGWRTEGETELTTFEGSVLTGNNR